MPSPVSGLGEPTPGRPRGVIYSLEAPRKGSAVETQPVAVLAQCDPQGPGASAVSATGEADHEWEVRARAREKLQLSRVEGQLWRRPGAGEDGCGLRVVGSEPQLTPVPGPPPGVLGAQIQRLWCRRGWAKMETFESFFRGGWKGRGKSILIAGHYRRCL